MIGKVSMRYAARSLRRHARRTVLSIIGVGVGCAIGLFSTSWMSGSAEMQIRAATESGTGHLRIVPNGWTETRRNTMRLADWKGALEAARQLSSVKAVSARARANGLLAFGNRTAGVEIVGVEPEVEKLANRIVFKSTLEGDYLKPGDTGKVVIGKALAKRLDVELDDDLYVTMVGRDEIRAAMLNIVGILDTGTRDIDLSICQVTLGDIERITGFSSAGDISILLEDPSLIAPAQRELVKMLAGADTVITWKEAVPGFAANVEGDKVFMRSIVFVIIVVVGLGIMSAQITAVLERRREFAILSALGMKNAQLVGLIVLESFFIGIGGAVAALLIGGPLAYWISTTGFDFAAFMGDDFSFENVLLDPIIYGSFGVWIVWYALSVSVAATVLASLWPAWRATKVNPADALRTV